MKNNNEYYVSSNSPGSYNFSKYFKGFEFPKSVENLILVLTTLRHLVLFGPYVQSRGRTSVEILRTVRPLQGFQGEPHLSTRLPSLQNNT